MTRSLLTLATLSVVLIAQPAFAQDAAAPMAITAADAAPFMGDWTLNMESPMGPSAIALSIKTDAGKVVGEISSDMMPKTPISDVAKSGTSLVLKYDFLYEGNPVPVVVTITPGDKIGATMDFAGGAFQMTGTATKVAKP